MLFITMRRARLAMARNKLQSLSQEEHQTAIKCVIAESLEDVPVIGFPRGCGASYIDYAKETKVDVLGVADCT